MVAVGTAHFSREEVDGSVVAHLTGAHTTSELSDSDGMYINWYYGGDKGNSWMSWKEAKMTLIHK